MKRHGQVKPPPKNKCSQENTDTTEKPVTESQGGPTGTDDKRSPNQAQDWPHHQQRWADPAIAIFTGLALIAYIIGNFFSYHQLKLTEASVDASIEEIHRSHRPWVSIQGPIQIIEPLTFSKPGVATRVSYGLKNNGTSPALRTFSLLELVVDESPPGGYPFDYLRPRLECSENLRKTIGDSMGISIFPGEVSEAAIAAPVQARVGAGENQPVSVWLKLCVSYRDEFNTQHMTGQAWHFRTKSDLRALLIPNGSYDGEFIKSGISSAR